MSEDHHPLKVLVTGGSGFLGRAIVGRLLARGDRVRVYSRGAYPDLAAMGVETARGDLADRAAVVAACADRDVVFHLAAKAGIWGRYADYHRANVEGTAHVLAGCRLHGVRRLVFTSSPSVVSTGSDMEGVDESAPYPTSFPTHYPKTKAIAERMVLAANAPDLQTVALRPHLIWGPGDTNLVPRIIARAYSLRRIGPIEKKVDCIYIDNAADAHLLACDRLVPGSPVAGKPYFISQGEPRGIWQLINGILAAAGFPPVERRISRGVAITGAMLCEAVHKILGIDREPWMTRFLMHELATAHWFNISAARRDLGYEPRVSIDEGLRRLGAWFEARKLTA